MARADERLLGAVLRAVHLAVRDRADLDDAYREVVGRLRTDERRALVAGLDDVLLRCTTDEQVAAELPTPGLPDVRDGLRPRARLFALVAEALRDPEGATGTPGPVTPVLAGVPDVAGDGLSRFLRTAAPADLGRLLDECEAVLVRTDGAATEDVLVAAGIDPTLWSGEGTGARGWLAGLRHRLRTRLRVLGLQAARAAAVTPAPDVRATASGPGPASGGGTDRAAPDPMPTPTPTVPAWAAVAAHAEADRESETAGLAAAAARDRLPDALHELWDRFPVERTDDLDELRVHVLQERALLDVRRDPGRAVARWYEEVGRHHPRYGWLPVRRGRFETDDTGWEDDGRDRLRSLMPPWPRGRTWTVPIPPTPDHPDTAVPESASDVHRVRDEQRLGAIRAAIDWWHVEALVVERGPGATADLPQALLGLGLDALRPGPTPATVQVTRATPSEAWAALFVPAAGGSAYGSGGRLARGRHLAARAMGALAGAAPDATFAEVEEAVLARSWWTVTADTDWHHGDGWETGVVSLSADGRELAVVLGSDTC